MSDDESNEARIEIGPVCPPIGSWFFPNDPTKEPIRIFPNDPIQIDKEEEDGDTPQSA